MTKYCIERKTITFSVFQKKNEEIKNSHYFDFFIGLGHPMEVKN